MHRVRPAIRRIPPPLHQTLTFQFVHQVHHRRLVGVHQVDQLTLAEVSALVQLAQHRDVGDVEAKRRQRLVVGHAEAPMGALQQEAGLVQAGALSHGGILPGKPAQLQII